MQMMVGVMLFIIPGILLIAFAVFAVVHGLRGLSTAKKNKQRKSRS
jgi:hypothetical protein